MKEPKAYSQDQLNQTLWDAANSSRPTWMPQSTRTMPCCFCSTNTSAISTSTRWRTGEAVREGPRPDRHAPEKFRFVLPKGTSFAEVYKKKSEDNIGELINIALHAIEDANGDRLEGLSVSIDFNSDVLWRTEQRNKMLPNLMDSFAKMDLTLAGDDVIGNAYMYMIERFGSDAGKKAGEFFTPHSVAALVAKLAAPRPGWRICDPACGSGGLLLLAGAEIEAQGSKDYALYGQESIGSTYNLARMNMFLHGKDSARLEWGDTLNHPLLKEGDSLMKFDLVLANPPFSLKKWMGDSTENDPYNRFHRGLPPKTKGDYAFISHMVETAKAGEGKVVVIVPHGVLFRGAAEGRIRKCLLEENLVDAVIGLPSNLFQTAAIPVAILILDRSREAGGRNEKRKDVLFVEASRLFKPGKARNYLEPEHIARILDVVREAEGCRKALPRGSAGGNPGKRLQPQHHPLCGHLRGRGGGGHQSQSEGTGPNRCRTEGAEKEMAGHLKALGLVN